MSGVRLSCVPHTPRVQGWGGTIYINMSWQQLAGGDDGEGERVGHAEQRRRVELLDLLQRRRLTPPGGGGY